MSKSKVATNEIRLKNRQMVYQFIRNQGSVSKQDIVVGLHLSLPTVTQNLQYLEEQGLIDTSKKIKNTGGRNATAYVYIKNAKLAIGVYITKSSINAVAVDLSGNVIEVVKERIKFNLDDDSYLKKIGDAVEQVKQNVGIADEDLLGVGIAVPSLVSDDGETVVYGLTLNFTGKTRKEIAKYIPYKNRLFHDSYVAGYAEVWINQHLNNAFYISLGHSVGGCVVMENGIYAGDTQKGGEIGHMTIVPQGGKQCYCGKYGCLDTVCNVGNLEQYTDGNLEEFFRLLKAGDTAAQDLWNDYLDYLALAIHNVRILFDSVVILGGYVGANMDDYIKDLYKRVDERNPFDDLARNYLILCKYKVEATATGSALIYINGFLKSI
ncbi:ROK family transcriptional regulator [Lachnospiraceae bacterium ZAX-1]